ncbi:tautomerase family protein [Mesorhizobium sp. DCY119]|uniref:tautomerase family protein n=1 Tax=Mesorhizobium sp. DCY119 TaxID=2108445 RepID=UPI000E6D4C1F|nr:tautomerase family protein [Mesorhizobium sp. DCY119]RJG46293.1 4-oxalocrotonate tautomerase [Mesorhizobium sp. DCY119]
MPTYVCWSAAGWLSAEQRTQIAEAITTIHAEEGRAPRYFVQVLFNEVQSDSHFIGSRAANDGHIWIRADIRSGRTDEHKKAILERIATDISAIAEVGREDVWVYLSDISAAGILEFGHVLPQPGEDDAWFTKLPDALQQRPKALS